MARVKRGTQARQRRRRILERAKGYRQARSRRHKQAKEAVHHAERYAWRDRRQRKRDFRKLWITRINAAAREEGMSYSRFIHGLRAADVDIDRKILADLAVTDPEVFADLVGLAKQTLGGDDDRASADQQETETARS